jgi:hypothetical protein
MAAKGIVGWLTDHWVLSAGALGLGTFFMIKKANASSGAATNAKAAAAVIATVPPAQKPAIEAALKAGALPVDVQAALNAGIAPATIAVVAQQGQAAGGSVADRMMAFAASHPDATDAEIQAAGSA